MTYVIERTDGKVGRYLAAFLEHGRLRWTDDLEQAAKCRSAFGAAIKREHLSLYYRKRTKVSKTND